MYLGIIKVTRLQFQEAGTSDGLSPEMQNSFAGELPLLQALRDLTNVVPESLHLVVVIK